MVCSTISWVRCSRNSPQAYSHISLITIPSGIPTDSPPSATTPRSFDELRRTSQAKPPPPELASGTGRPLLSGEEKQHQEADDLLSSDVAGTAEGGGTKDNDNASLGSEGKEEEEGRGGSDASSSQPAVVENVPETDFQEERVEQATSGSGSGGEETPPSDAVGDAGDGPTALAGADETGGEDPALLSSPSGRQEPEEGGSVASDIAEGPGSPSAGGKEVLAEISGISTPPAEEGGDAVGERGNSQASPEGGGSEDDDDGDGAAVSHISDEYGDDMESEEEDNVFAAEPPCEDATASAGTGVEGEEAGMTRDEAGEGGSCEGDDGEEAPAETTARITGGDDVSAPEAGFVGEDGGGYTAPVGSVDSSTASGEGGPEVPVENPSPPPEAPDEPLTRDEVEPAGGSGDDGFANPDGATGQVAAEPGVGPNEAAGEDERSPGVPEAESVADVEGEVSDVGDAEAAEVVLSPNGGKTGGADGTAEDRGGSSALLAGEAMPPEGGGDVDGGQGGPQEEEEEEDGTGDDVVFLQVRWRPCSCVAGR